MILNLIWNAKDVPEKVATVVTNLTICFKEENMWFELKRVLTPVTADDLVNGQKGWVNDSIEYLMSDVKDLPPYRVVRTEDMDYPFRRSSRSETLGVNAYLVGKPKKYFYPAE